MKRRLIDLLFAGGVALGAIVLFAFITAPRSVEKTTARAQTAPQAVGNTGTSGVTVQGNGVALVKPNIVRFSAGVDSRAATVAEAQKQAADKLKAITEAIKAQGVAEEDIVTSSYDISPNYIYQNNQPPRLEGYIVRSQLSIILRDTSKAGPVIDSAGNAGANQVGGISFTVDKNDEAVKQARQAAMADAKNKADQLASFGGFSLGGVVSVVELGGSSIPRVATNAGDVSVASGVAAKAPAPETVIESGQFRVVVNVQVVYAIQA